MKKHGQYEDKLTNAINPQKSTAIKKYNKDLLPDKNSSKSTWSAIHQLPNRASFPKQQVNFNISVERSFFFSS